MRIADGTVVAGATAPYAAPELFRPGAVTSPEADRFAFAATVAHMILGEAPPAGGAGPDLDRTEEMLRRHPLSARRHMLQRQVMGALRAGPEQRPDPEQRPKSLSSWLSALTDSLSVVTEDVADTDDVGETQVGHGQANPVPAATAAPPTGPSGRRRYLAAAAAGAALLSVAGLIAVEVWPTPATAALGLPTCTETTASPSAATASSSSPPSRNDPDQLLIFASKDKATLLADLARDYGPRQADGRCITIRVEPRDFGKFMKQSTDGWTDADWPRADVWSPPTSAWFALVAYKAKAGVLPANADSLFTTPVVIGMPKPMAEALGWPNTDIGWQDLSELAQDPNGWGRYHHPEWGAFRLGKTNPNYSSAGFMATIGAYVAATGHDNELTEGDINDPRAQEFVKSIERSVVHYGDTTLTFLANLRRADDHGAGLSYVSAVALAESSVVRYNLGYPCGAASSEPECAKTGPPKTPLVAIYPKEGTRSGDHPYVKMPGLSTAKNSVADDFLRYVHLDRARDKIADVGLRTFDGQQTAKLVPENGAVPTVRVRTLNQPQPTMLDRIKAQPWWDQPVAYEQDNNGHGRYERRAIRVLPAPEDLDFPDAQQVFLLERTVVDTVKRRKKNGRTRTKKKTSYVRAYGVTSLTAEQASPADLANLVRDHWQVEAHHNIRDTTFNEDASQIRTGNGPRVLATLRNIVIDLFRCFRFSNMAAARREMAWDHTGLVLNLLGV
jgi:predicted transposase YbfD/YdcC